LINSNPAQYYDRPFNGYVFYLKPLTNRSIEILKHTPSNRWYLDGGQTALNLCLEADEKEFGNFGFWLIGVDVNTINITEDRDSSSNCLKKKIVPSAPAEICTSYLRGKRIAVWFPS
jgi:carbamoyl-phosphate synthase large subunit